MFDYKKKLLEPSQPQPRPLPGKTDEADAVATLPDPNEKAGKRILDLELELKEQLNKLESTLKSQERKDAFPKKKPYSRRGLITALIIAVAILIWAGGTIAFIQWQLHQVKTSELNRLHQEVAQRLDQEFEKKTLQQLMDQKTSEKTTKVISEYVTEKVNSTVLPFANEMKALLKKTNGQGEEARKNLESVYSFLLLTARAKNDDRKAFDELLTIARTRGNPFQNLAESAVTQIYAEVNSSLSFLAEPAVAKDQEALVELDFEKFKMAYSRTIPLYRPSMLAHSWASQKYSKFQKLSFLMDVLRNDSSIRAAQKACELIETEAQIRKNFIAYEKYLDWWDANKESMQPS